MDQYYAKGTEWQWFIDIIEEDYDFEDISEWKEYESLCWRWLQLYVLLEKIVEVGNKSLSIKQPMLNDAYLIANFRQGTLAVKEAIDGIESVFGRVFFWVVWATKIEKQDNDLEYIYDNDLFNLRNMWQSRNLVSLELYEDELVSYGKKIPLIDISDHIQCLQENINKTYYYSRVEFVNSLEKTYPVQELFGYQSNQVKIFSWQERIIVGLINNGLNRNSKKYPIENIFNKCSEDYIIEQLGELKDYYSNKITDFLIETVLFLWRGTEPSVNSKRKYLSMWKLSYEEEENFRRFDNAGYWCVSNMFAKGITANVKDSPEFNAFLNTLHEIKDIYDLQRLIEAKFPLSKEQKGILREYQENAYRKLDEITNPHSLEDYMKSDVVCKSIDTEYFCKLRQKFLDFLGENSIKRLLPSYFYCYMVFLIKTKNMAKNVSKKEIDVTIIGIQKLWENQYYNVACQDLQMFSSKTEVSNAEVEKYNEGVLLNPLAFARLCMNLDEKSVCEVMERASEHAINYMISRMALSKTYPIKNESINLVRHDVDGFLDEFIGRIKDEKSYRFLNVLDNNKYLLALYEDIHLRSRMCISMFHKEQVIYENLVRSTDIKLLPYSEELLLAHVTQLFPILEMKIREVSTIFGVAPFKEDLNSFMQFKDPSSLLREMIEEAFNETGNFDLIYDLMFVYSFMYNSNSLNIRNECIHGRGYNTTGEIRFAFRVTLLSIYMMEYRIKLISDTAKNKR